MASPTAERHARGAAAAATPRCLVCRVGMRRVAVDLFECACGRRAARFPLPNRAARRFLEQPGRWLYRDR